MTGGRRCARVICPAKVNRFLAVGPPDRRGYHPLRTLFQTITLADTLVLTETTGTTELFIEGAEIPAENTLTKTLRLVRELIDLPPMRIHLIKQIPAESGLGGGSSDAAGLLRGLNALGYPLPWDQAESVAAAVGADVPFFLVGGLARGEGYGERLTALPDPIRESLVVVRPSIGISTPAAYRELDAAPARPWADFPPDHALTPFNDFELVAPLACRELLDWLRAHGATAALLCGSGSAVFGVFESPQAAAHGADRARAAHLGEVWTAETLGRDAALAVELSPA